jgi:NitT/TauT family transport system ATP-binding protein
MGSTRRSAKSTVESNLELVDLAGFEKKFPWQLSGGMQQRASIARALAVEPDMLLMDEPFGALDEIVRDHLNEQLAEALGATKKTVVFVTHSIPEAVFLSTKIVVMSPRPGRIHEIIDCDLGDGTAARYPRNAGVPEDRPPGARGLGQGTAYDD